MDCERKQQMYRLCRRSRRSLCVQRHVVPPRPARADGPPPRPRSVWRQGGGPRARRPARPAAPLRGAGRRQRPRAAGGASMPAAICAPLRRGSAFTCDSRAERCAALRRAWSAGAGAPARGDARAGVPARRVVRAARSARRCRALRRADATPPPRSRDKRGLPGVTRDWNAPVKPGTRQSSALWAGCALMRRCAQARRRRKTCCSSSRRGGLTLRKSGA